MWGLRLFRDVLFVLGVLIVGALTVSSARAQSDDEFQALYRQVQELHQAGNYADAMRIGEHYMATAEKRHGEQHPEYATAIGWLAQLLHESNRLAEAEPLMRRALAIIDASALTGVGCLIAVARFIDTTHLKFATR